MQDEFGEEERVFSAQRDRPRRSADLCRPQESNHHLVVIIKTDTCCQNVTNPP
jgi:hypothetical protein